MTVNAEKFCPDDVDLPVLRAVLEQRLSGLLVVAGEQDMISAAMREGALTPGKRIRPLLLLLAARDLGCDEQHPGLVDLACAVEMVHAASLILDDLPCMDNAYLRRNRPTVHRQYGQHVAILAAIALLSKAFGLIADASTLTATCRSEAVSALAAAVGLQGLVQGQFEDLCAGQAARSPAAVARTNDLKTGVLFDATLQVAALAAGSSAAVRHSLHCSAHELGQAFQLLDDLADSQMGTGKDPHQDAGKPTLVALLGADRIRQRLHEHLARADRHFACVSNQGQATRHFMHSLFQQQLATFG